LLLWCLTVLIDFDNEVLDHDLEIDPRDALGLKFYATQYWMTHAQNLKTREIVLDFPLFSKSFLGPLFPAVLHIANSARPHQSFFWCSDYYIEDFKPFSSAASTICAFGFYNILSD